MLVDFSIWRQEIVKYLKYKGSSKKFLVFKMLNTLVAEFKISKFSLSDFKNSSRSDSL
jgi:hypothetical protein